MRTMRLTGMTILTAAVLTLPGLEAWGQKDKKKEMPPDAGPKDSAKIPAGEYIGILKGSPGSDRTFTIEIEVQKMVAAGGGGGGRPGGGGGGNAQGVIRAQQRLGQAQAQLARAGNPQQRQQAQNAVRQATIALQRAMAQMQGAGGKGGGAPPGFRIEKEKVLVEFQATEKVKVRTMLLPEVFDDKGFLKKYTKEELSALKGADKSAVGYESALEKLENGQKIRVVSAVVAKATGGVAAKDKDEEVDPEKSKQVKLIVVLEAADPALAKGDKKKKK